MSRYPEICFDQGLYFRKQTLRNRYHILSPNGNQALIIPTVHTGGKSQPMGEVKISYADNWTMKHWRSLEAAYRRSPFFEFYEDDLRQIYFAEHEKLSDFNKHILEWIFSTLGINTAVRFSEVTPGPEFLGPDDHRSLSETGDPDTSETDRYLQVFAGKMEFVPGLSVLDAVFNCGKAVHLEE